MTRSLAPRPRTHPHRPPHRPPNPNTWHTFLCQRCDQPFKHQGIARHCTKCIHAAATANITGSEHIGEASGA